VDSLPSGPGFKREVFTITGDIKDEKGNLLTEEVELWGRDAKDCVASLLSNVSFREDTHYAPVRVHRLNEKQEKVREISEMHTANWWWDMQVRFSPKSQDLHLLRLSDAGKAKERCNNRPSDYCVRQNCSLRLQWRQVSIPCLCNTRKFL
jgi:hypothetical protein